MKTPLKRIGIRISYLLNVKYLKDQIKRRKENLKEVKKSKRIKEIVELILILA